MCARGLNETGECKRVTLRKGPWSYVHMIYIWNCSAELELYNQDITGHVCENQTEMSMNPRSAQMCFSMDTACTASKVQLYSCFPGKKKASLYKIISFSGHGHQNGMTGCKTGDLLGRKKQNKTKRDNNNGKKKLQRSSMFRVYSCLPAWEQLQHPSTSQVRDVITVKNKPHRKNHFLKTVCILDFDSL